MFRMMASVLCKLVVCSVILCGASTSFCQYVPSGGAKTPGTEGSTYTPHLAFDVVSIHESGEGRWSYIDNVPKTSFFEAVRVSPWGLILTAYNLKIVNLLKNLPPWAMTTRFDVTAKSDSSTDEALAKLSDSDFYAEKHHMLQGVLAERFKLQIHPETMVSTVYELVTTPQTAKLMTPVQGDVAKTVSTCNIHFSKESAEIESKGCPFPALLSSLRGELGTDVVVDHTGLSGMYAYHLMWSRPSSMPLRDGEDRYPEIVDAMREQLGLELKKTKAPVTFWVVDHIERPSAN